MTTKVSPKTKHVFELTALKAEDRHLAARAAEDISNGKELIYIETAELEALFDIISIELMDRYYVKSLGENNGHDAIRRQ